MSDNWLIFIPTSPSYVPPVGVRDEALELFRSMVTGADEVNALVYDKVFFIPSGENLSTAFCPRCGSELPVEWWKRAMNLAGGIDPDAGENNTRDWRISDDLSSLEVTVPCCGASMSLNDMNYDWPSGFAHFALEALWPPGDLTEEQIARLEAVLGCKLRKIWAHY